MPKLTDLRALPPSERAQAVAALMDWEIMEAIAVDVMNFHWEPMPDKKGLDHWTSPYWPDDEAFNPLKDYNATHAVIERLRQVWTKKGKGKPNFLRPRRLRGGGAVEVGRRGSMTDVSVSPAPYASILDDALEEELLRDRIVEAAKRLSGTMMITSGATHWHPMTQKAMKDLDDAVWQLWAWEKRGSLG